MDFLGYLWAVSVVGGTWMKYPLAIGIDGLEKGGR